MFKVYLSWTVNPGVGISLPATIEEMRETYSLLNGTDTIPLETATAYVESSIPNLCQHLCKVPVLEKRLEELNYLAYHVKWVDSQDETVFGTVIKMVESETLQSITDLSCNMDRFRYLPGIATEAELGKYLLKGYLDMTMEEQAVKSSCEWIGKDYMKKHDGMFHASDYTSGTQEGSEPIYGGNELLDPGFKQTYSFKVWIYKESPYDNYILTLLATESKMNTLRGAMGISDWSKCRQLDIQCRVSTLWDWLPEYGPIEELNDLVIEHCQSMKDQ